MSRRNDCGARHGRGYRGAVPEPRCADSRFVRDHSLRVMQYGTTQGKPPVLPLTSPPRPTSISRSPPAASHPAPFASIFKCLLTISTHNPSHQGDDSTHGQAPYLTPAALHVTHGDSPCQYSPPQTPQTAVPSHSSMASKTYTRLRLLPTPSSTTSTASAAPASTSTASAPAAPAAAPAAAPPPNAC